MTHALGYGWPIAFVLGAVLAPTDAAAVDAVAKAMPRRTLTWYGSWTGARSSGTAGSPPRSGSRRPGRGCAARSRRPPC
ncbi:hypothetical protein ACWDG9_09455 [Streptomyces sp. NPDC001073]